MNAVTFRYFQRAEGSELLARTFLVSPAEVEQNVRIKSASKRTNLSVQQFDEIADCCRRHSNEHC